MHIVSLIQCHLSVIIEIFSPSVPFGSDALNQLKIPTAWAPKARRATSHEVQAWRFSLYYWSNQLFCSPHSLCSNHSIWPHMDSYVPNCYGDISPSLMVLFISIFSYFRCQPICCKSPQISDLSNKSKRLQHLHSTVWYSGIKGVWSWQPKTSQTFQFKR